MGEDRRPNVGGAHPPETQEKPAMDHEQVMRDAKSLGKRAGADGHRGSSPADVREGK